jgi:hypothetical protein
MLLKAAIYKTTNMTRRLTRRIVSPATLGAVYVIVVATIVAGCGKSKLDRVIVHGRVHFAGEPVQTGVIRFIPTEGTATPPGAAQIVNGNYRVEARGGVPVGTHKIEIEAFRPLPPGKKNPEMEAMKKEHPHFTFPEVREQYVPARYNENTELRVTIPSDSGEFEHNIELTP